MNKHCMSVASLRVATPLGFDRCWREWVGARAREGGPLNLHSFVKMAAQQEEFIAGKDLDDLYALLDNGFLNEDVDFEKDLAALVIAESHEANFCCDECSKVCKTQQGLTRHKNTQHSSSRNSNGVPVIEKKLHADVLLRIINEQKAVSMACVYLKRVEIVFRKKTLYLHLKTLFNCYKN